MAVKIYQMAGQVVWAPYVAPDPTRVSNAYQLVAYEEQVTSGSSVYSMQQLVARVTFTFGDVRAVQAYQLLAAVQEPPGSPDAIASLLSRASLVGRVMDDPASVLGNQALMLAARSAVQPLVLQDPSEISNNYRAYTGSRSTIQPAEPPD